MGSNKSHISERMRHRGQLYAFDNYIPKHNLIDRVMLTKRTLAQSHHDLKTHMQSIKEQRDSCIQGKSGYCLRLC